MSDPDTKPLTFEDDIAPEFLQYRAQMLWRLDLTNYDDVVQNAQLILGQIKTKSMPPDPFPPLSDQFIQGFENWIGNNFPLK